MAGSTPNIPGFLVGGEQLQHLREHVAELLGRNNLNFPGSQPVSFDSTSVQKLLNQNFWVCEKSDGIRALLFIVLIPDEAMGPHKGLQQVFLIDRKNDYYEVPHIQFPSHLDKNLQGLLQQNTLLDGELVLDVDPKSGQEKLRFIAFDLLIINSENICSKSLEKRYGRLKEWVIKPLHAAQAKYPAMLTMQPFQVLQKPVEASYRISKVLNDYIPKLLHGNDGLIFTCSETAYVHGTDLNIIKWKEPSENSIDFKLELRFPSISTNPRVCDYHAKPNFLLHEWSGGSSYSYFDSMDMPDDQWEKLKETEIFVDDRVVEVSWDFNRQTWRFLRFRDDKTDGNHKTVVEAIIKSIQDGIPVEELIAREDEIKANWKSREAESKPA